MCILCASIAKMFIYTDEFTNENVQLLYGDMYGVLRLPKWGQLGY